jgi:hypothetical protein
MKIREQTKHERKKMVTKNVTPYISSQENKMTKVPFLATKLSFS